MSGEREARTGPELKRLCVIRSPTERSPPEMYTDSSGQSDESIVSICRTGKRNRCMIDKLTTSTSQHSVFPSELVIFILMIIITV